MPGPIISILHPTKRIGAFPSFPRGWKGACEQWASAAVHPERIEYILIVHESNWLAFWRDIDGAGASLPAGDTVQVVSVDSNLFGSFHVMQNHGRNCVVDQINAGAAAATGSLLVGIMDDLEAPDRWDATLLASLPVRCTCGGLMSRVDSSYWCPVCPMSGKPRGADLDGEYVIDLTGEATEHIVYSALTRKRYERFGHVLDPRFESMYADNWYSRLAHQDGCVIDGRGLGFVHNHPTNGRAEMDEVYAGQNSAGAYRKGYALYRKLTEGTRSISLLIPGEWFPHRVMFGWFDVLEYLHAKGFLVERFGAHTSNVYATRIELTDAALTIGIESDFILSADDDNVLTPEHVDMLIADADKHPDIDIFCGWSWCDTGDYETQPFRMSCGRQGPNLECKFFTVEDFTRMQAAGKIAITSDDLAPDAFWSGFPVVLIRRRALERLGWAAFLPMLGKDFHRGFTSEDTTFFYRAHQAGIKCAVDLRVKSPHLKLRAIEPQIIPASERAGILRAMEDANRSLHADGPADENPRAERAPAAVPALGLALCGGL